jgi:hypothetical protein
MIYRLLTVFIITGCAAYVPETKEWNDRYDPAAWRKQFEECRDKLYTTYPEEVNQDQWSKCMEIDYEFKES